MNIYDLTNWLPLKQEDFIRNLIDYLYNSFSSVYNFEARCLLVNDSLFFDKCMIPESEPNMASRTSDDSNHPSAVVKVISELINQYARNQNQNLISHSASANPMISILHDLTTSCSREISIAPIIYAVNIRLLLASTFSKAAIYNKVVKFSAITQNISILLRVTPILSDNSIFTYADQEIIDALSSKLITYETYIVILNILSINSLYRANSRLASKYASLLMKVLFAVLKLSPVGMKSHHNASSTSTQQRRPSFNKRLSSMRDSVDTIASNLESKFLLDSHHHRKSDMKVVVFEAIENLISKDDHDHNIITSSNSCTSSHADMKASRVHIIWRDMMKAYANYVHHGLDHIQPLEDIFDRINIFYDHMKSSCISSLYPTHKQAYLIVSYEQRFYDAFVASSYEWVDGYASYVIQDDRLRNIHPPRWFISPSSTSAHHLVSFFQQSSSSSSSSSSCKQMLGGSKWQVIRAVMISSSPYQASRISGLMIHSIDKVESLIKKMTMTSNDDDLTCCMSTLLSCVMIWEFEVAMMSHYIMREENIIISNIHRICCLIIMLEDHIDDHVDDDDDHIIISILYHMMTAGLGYIMIHLSPALISSLTSSSTSYDSIGRVFSSADSMIGMHHIVAAFVSTMILPKFGLLVDESLLRGIISHIDVIQYHEDEHHSYDFIQVDMVLMISNISPSLSSSMESIIQQYPHHSEPTSSNHHHIAQHSNMHSLSHHSIKRFLSSYMKKWYSKPATLMMSTYDHKSSLPLDKLPIDVVTDVFLGYLSSKRLCRLASTCKFYRDLIISNQHIWKNLFFHRYPESISYDDHGSRSHHKKQYWMEVYKQRCLMMRKVKMLRDLEVGYAARLCPYIGCRIILRRQDMSEVRYLICCCTSS